MIQAIRLTHLAAARYAETRGDPTPPSSAIDVGALVGQLLAEPPGSLSEEQVEQAELS